MEPLMNTAFMGTYKPSQKLHPLSLLAQMTSRQVSGCLQISSGTVSWTIYLEQGRLIYATNSVEPFGRLDRHLRRLSIQVPSLVSAIRAQARLLFETPDNASSHSRDYQAICWLVEHQHLNVDQATSLIEGIAREVIELLLSMQTGYYDLDEQEPLQELPKLCHLDLRRLTEECQNQLRRHQATGRAINPPAEPPGFLNQQNGTYASSTYSPPAYSPPAYSPPAESLPKPEPVNAPSPINPLPPSRTTQPAASSNRGTYTIACIDDSPTVLQAINSFLDDNSFSVVLISDPVKALMQIIRSKPDLILLDVTMPNLDGYELCSLLRKHPNFKHTPIIMVTGCTGFIDRAKAKLVGASGYLTKPFTQSDLIKMVFRHLS
jgi:twitching motility two-component system response regulator PilG